MPDPEGRESQRENESVIKFNIEIMVGGEGSRHKLFQTAT